MSGFQQGAFQPIAFQGPYTPTLTGTITDTYSFDPDLAECFEDAFERAGMSVQGVSQEHIASAIRSTKFMLNSEWSTLGIKQWQIVQATQTTTTGDVDFDLPAGAIDVFYAMLRRGGVDIPMYPMSRTDYDAIPNKTARGRPNQYFVRKQYNRLTMFLWNAPENNTDIVVYDYFRQIADSGEMFNTLQMPPMAQDCFVTGLAMRLAQKFKRERYNELRMEYGGPYYPEKIGGKLFHMRAEAGERADVALRFPRGRRR